MTTDQGTYDEALERYHRTGPEFDGFLSNHGPMVVELLARRDEGARIHRWTDAYVRRLDELPRSVEPIDPDGWREALGRSDRASDWIAFQQLELAEAPWREVLARWWQRLLPGIAAGATHGVIRTGHAVRALLEHETQPRRDELGQALGYWAARWLPVPAIAPRGDYVPADVFAALPRIADQQGGVAHRLGQLASTTGWSKAVTTLRPPATDDEIPAALDRVVDDAVAAYRLYGVGNPTMLVHASTAPNAVAAALPALPRELWRSSFETAWVASAALVSEYAPSTPAEPLRVHSDTTPADILERALAHGGEHVLKLTDAALASYARTSAPEALVAALTAVDLDA